jgi:hypothetical protein
MISNLQECPSLLECETAVTNDFFKRICSSRGYVRCHHHARNMGELETPMAWLQRLAMHVELKNVEDQQSQSSSIVK